MEDSCKYLFYGIAKDLNKNPDDMNPIIKKLEDNWYYHLKDLEGLNQEIWKSLQLPLNLFNLLQKKISEIKEKSLLNDQKNDNNIKIEMNIKYDFNKLNSNSNVKPISQGNQMIDYEEDLSQIKDNLKILIFDLCTRVMIEINKKRSLHYNFQEATSNHFKYNNKPKR